MRLFQTALDLADAREGRAVRGRRAIRRSFVSTGGARRPARHPDADAGQAAALRRGAISFTCSKGASATDLDYNVLAALASLDGATVFDRAGRLLAAGAILRHPPLDDAETASVIEGARTTAAMAASRFGPVLKVSEDGVITFFDRGQVWDI